MDSGCTVFGLAAWVSNYDMPSLALGGLGL